MSIQSDIMNEIGRVSDNISDTYDTAEEMGAEMPEQRNSNNLSSTIRTIPQGAAVPTTNAMLKGDGVGGVTEAVAGTDYVAPQEGKGLSSNDYTDADESKLASIEAGAQVNVLTSINGKIGDPTLDAADVGALPESEEKTIRDQARRIHLLELAAEGNIYADETDSVAAYSKAIPTEALDCRIDSFGGKSMQMNQLSETPSATITASTSFKFISKAATVVGNKYLYYNKCSRASDGMDDFQVYCKSAWARYNVENQSNIFQATDSFLYIYASAYEQFGTDVTSNTYVIDLTRIYGAGNEPAETSDARIAELEAYVDSHPEYDAGTVISADVSAIELSDENEETVTKSIPAAIRALPGYGWSNGTVCNEVDIKNKQYIQRVDGTSGEIVVLDEPIITDISDLLPEGFERFDEVYPEGSITFVQDGGTMLAVPNTETYKIKLPVNATALAAAIDAQLALAAIEALGGGADV